MTMHIYQDEENVAIAAASMFTALVVRKPDCVLGLATGSSPIKTYRKMIENYQEGAVDYSRVTTYNLDEYVGLSHDHTQSYYYFMHQNLFSGINIQPENTHVPDGIAKNRNQSCKDYDAAVEAAHVDLQILGIGRNGHIAFNEPAAVFYPHTHTVALTESTIEANRRFFEKEEDVPRHAVTMGIGTIMKAQAIVLLATGADKAEAVKKMIQGPIDPQCPASILQLHSNVTILLDKAAASLL